MKNSTILYNVPKVSYGTIGCTPYPLCLQACSEYLGTPVSYSQIMGESGAAFRLVWDTVCWNGGNVDTSHTFDQPEKIYQLGLKAIGRDYKMLERTSKTKKQEFIDFIRQEIDFGNPVIALGIIGPPEACILTGYDDNGNTLIGWNFFQDYPEYQSTIDFEENGYFRTKNWWENPDTKGLFATSVKNTTSFTTREVLENAIEALQGRMYKTYAKGTLAYDAWKQALLCEQDWPDPAVYPLLVERMMCHGDAMDCLSEGRWNAAQYLRNLAEKYPVQAEKLTAAALEFESVSSIISKEMVPVLGGFERGEKQIRQLAKPETRQLFGVLIDRMKTHDEQALAYMRELIDTF